MKSQSYRTCPFEIQDEIRTATAATENAVPMPDYERGQVIPEILLMSGAKFKKSVPLLDCHKRSTIENTKGTATNLRVQGDSLLCDLEISSAEESTRIKVDEKTITDLSVGYDVLKKIYVAPGDSKVIGGRTFTGPLNVVTSWRLYEISLTPIGADSAAKIRSSIINTDEETLFDLSERQDNPSRRPMENENKIEEVRTAPQVENTVDIDALIETKVAERSAQIEKQYKEKNEIRTLCTRHGMEDISESGVTLDEARAKILNFVSSKTQKLNVSIGESSVEKRAEAVAYALGKRSLTNFRPETVENVLGKEVQGWRDFAGISLLDLAEDDLKNHGVNTRNLSRDEIARQALRMGAYRSEGGYYTPGTLPSLMLDASNKSLAAGYAEAPSTWQIVATQLPSANDFKDLNVVSLSEIGLLDAWDGVDTPSQAYIGDGKETLKVIAYAKNFSTSYITTVNDDLGGLTRALAAIGAAARRTLNTRFWDHILSNPTMSDGYALFNDTYHANHVDSGAVPSSSTFDVLWKKMGTQTGRSGAILGLQGRFLVGGGQTFPALKRIVNSDFDYTVSNQYGAKNIYNELIPVFEPLISGKDYYLFADKSSCEAAVVSFLKGQETPKLEFSIDPKNLSQNIFVTQAAAVGVIDHRGIVKQDGE